MDAKTIKQEQWPELAFENWKDTIATLHLWTQIVGKIRLTQMPWLNHSWHVALYVSANGLTTGSIPYPAGVFQIDFDFIHHVLHITTSAGGSERVELYPRSVADFYRELFEKLKLVDIDASISTGPNEVDPAIPFEKDETHQSYDAERAHDFYLALVKIHNVFTKFRARFTGKCSPVHFFWGSFDMAVTRFSGRPAPLFSGEVPNIPLPVMQEAYSHEVSSCGFWPGNKQFPHPAFYSYCYPSLAEFSQQPVKPNEAFFSGDMGEFILLYEVVQRSDNPGDTLMQFLQSTYEAASITAKWDKKTLECDFSSFNE
ncbi:DUF5996 family protein [Mucilaginibacter sp. OK098]|uniref:DUF5996 family protein n=1 Tax=Mucilaginibacter sp. OK098 TaxID=1855297 RepID=UPI00091C5780|nr:DUF5996 family protein [Mucilaginibacter sp. OK098]SHN21361.1 hypothetical protein SAMN05216524_106502 [Mucilaginibacter sp. OK098]